MHMDISEHLSGFYVNAPAATGFIHRLVHRPLCAANTAFRAAGERKKVLMA
jgi:hypothetical protein